MNFRVGESSKKRYKRARAFCPEIPDLFYNRVFMGQFPLPDTTDNNLLALRSNTLCQCSKMIPWQHKPNVAKKHTK
jgi:hypothetical protein